MADSLDALLDEVEAKFCREISVSHRAPSCTVKAEQDNHGQQRSKDFVHRQINKLKKASSILGTPLECLRLVVERRMLRKRLTTMQNTSRPLHNQALSALSAEEFFSSFVIQNATGSLFCQLAFTITALCQERNLFSGITINSISDTYKVEGVDDIEAVLQEILDDDYPASSSHRPVLSKTCSVESCSQTALKTCSPVCLGGSAIARGVGTSVTQKVCDRLRCTSCDFRVVMFDDQEWDSSCDYLFFRNNMPDCNKLRVKLKRRRGARAYACQCSWHSAVILSELGHIPNLKWVCGKHTAC